jgi:hypothetical protein
VIPGGGVVGIERERLATQTAAVSGIASDMARSLLRRALATDITPLSATVTASDRCALAF